MSRLFNGTSDQMMYTVDAGTAMNDALTMLVVCRILAADNVWMSLLEGQNSADSEVRAALGRSSSGNNIYFGNHIALIQAGSVTAADNWQIIAVTRSAAAASSAHKLPIGGSRTTTALGALADGNTLASGHLRLGGIADFANYRLAAAAIWNGVELTNGQLDGILSAKTTASIDALNPTWLVDDSDAFATNLTNPGVMDRTSISGTTDDADDPAGWVYGLSGGTDYTGTVPAAAGATASGPSPVVNARPYVNISVS